MEVRAGNGKGPKLFDWDPVENTIHVIRKDMYYSVQLNSDSYLICEECSKYTARKTQTETIKNN